MKKFLSILLIAALLAVTCTGCKKEKKEEGSGEASGGLTAALEGSDNGPGFTVVDPELDEPDEDAPAEVSEQEIAPETTPEPAEPSESTSTVVSSGNVMPFATEAPQPNTAITSYLEVNNTGLGFKFNYPANWNNIPGRYTICYVQPMTNGTVYPARVAVTMKKLSHACGPKTQKEEMASYIKNLKTVYTKFKVDNQLDTDTVFMGKKGMATTYVAYDGSQEIKGYLICNHFERYLFVFHFLCAYGDYDAFYPSICKMRDSVQVEEVKNK